MRVFLYLMKLPRGRGARWRVLQVEKGEDIECRAV